MQGDDISITWSLTERLLHLQHMLHLQAQPNIF